MHRIIAGSLACVFGALGCGDPGAVTRRDVPSTAGAASAMTREDAGPPWAPWASQEACLMSIGDQVIRDHDGDGVEGVWLIGCGGEQQTGLAYSNMDDCDDSDAGVSVKGFRDADADGWTTREMGCFATLPAGYRALRSTTYDCDDSSAALQEIAYVDADNDNNGAPESARCAAAPRVTPLPPGLSASHSDCNDDVAAIHPGAFEQWHDSVDSNCDGHEGPLDCEGSDPSCGCELFGMTTVPVDVSCASSDLFVVASYRCEACSGYNAVVVGNRGSLAAVGGFDVELEGGETLHVAEDLAPGAASHPFLVWGAVPSIEVVSPAEDCDGGNDQATLPNPSGLCGP